MPYYNGDCFAIDHYKFNGQSFIVCDSGKSRIRYFIDKEGCDCKGFKYRNSCRHYEGATSLGLIKQMNKENESLKKSLKDNFCRNCGTSFAEEDNYCGFCGKKRA